MTAPLADYEPIEHPAELTVGDEFDLGAQAVRALRLREVNVKEAFTLRDSSGSYLRATLLACDETRARAMAYERMPQSPESPARITLVCAVLARQRMMTVMQKATELGVARIVPVLSERSVPASGLAHEKAHAWPGQVIRAMRQCRRASVPIVMPTASLETVLAQPEWAAAAARFYLDDRAAKNAGTVSLPARRTGDEIITVAVAIGPEGGFTDLERRLLEDTRATALRLGSRVLRAETAVLVGVTLLQHQLGDLALT